MHPALKNFNFEKMFTREKLMEFLRTMAWVAPLTILIWVYAEREQIKRVNDVTFSVSPRSTAAGRVATLAPPSQRNVTIEMEGPAVKLDALRQQLLTGLPANALQLEIDSTASTGPITRRTVDILNEHPTFRNAGVRVTAASPTQLTVQVDDVVSRDLTVAADMQAANFEAAPVFDPPIVKISGPKRLIDNLTAMDNLGRPIIRPNFQQSPFLKVPGPHEINDVPLTKPTIPNDESNGQLLTVTPDRVKVSFRIRQADVTYTIPAMPVFPVAPANFLDEYRAVFEPVVTNITVQGPPDLIAALKADTLTKKPKALLEFGREDLPLTTPGTSPKPISRKLRFDLPPGLTVAPQDQNRELEFTLILRTATP